MNLLGAPASRRPVGSRKPEFAGETPALPGTVARFRGPMRECFRGIHTLFSRSEFQLSHKCVRRRMRRFVVAIGKTDNCRLLGLTPFLMATYFLYSTNEPVPFRYLTVVLSAGRLPPPYRTKTLPADYLEFAIADFAEGSPRGLSARLGRAQPFQFPVFPALRPKRQRAGAVQNASRCLKSS